MAEERGQATPGDKDEEEKYSGVVRNPNAYVPPGARKGGAGIPARKPEPKAEAKPAAAAAADKAPEVVAPVPVTPASKTNGSAPSAPPATAPAAAEVANIPIVQAPSPTPASIPTRSSADPVIDPAIASQGPRAAPTTMMRSTSQVPPASNGSDAAAAVPLSTSPALQSIPPMGAVVDQARQFVNLERERVEARKQSMAKTERAHVLSDLKAWQSKFKVPLPIPKDILPILTKDEVKQKAIEEKATKALHEEKPKAASKSPSPSPAPPAAVAVAARPPPSPQPDAPKAAAGPKKIAMKIPEIPPFKRKAPPAVPVPETAAQNISLVTSPTPSHTSITSGGAAAKLNPNASAFVFKPNPSAAAFKPSDSSAVNSPASQAAKLPGTPVLAGAAAAASSTSTASKNPFYREGPPKRLTVNPRDDFNPFKHGQVPSASAVAPQWPYTGRRSSIALSGPPVHPGMQPGSFEGEDPSSPHQGPPQMLQGGVPPQFMNYYRYPPGMHPQMQGGMLGPMFQPGSGFISPQQMGQSPSHHGQPPHPGPNGMPLYFPNGMPRECATRAATAARSRPVYDANYPQPTPNSSLLRCSTTPTDLDDRARVDRCSTRAKSHTRLLTVGLLTLAYLTHQCSRRCRSRASREASPTSSSSHYLRRVGRQRHPSMGLKDRRCMGRRDEAKVMAMSRAGLACSRCDVSCHASARTRAQRACVCGGGGGGAVGEIEVLSVGGGRWGQQWRSQ